MKFEDLIGEMPDDDEEGGNVETSYGRNFSLHVKDAWQLDRGVSVPWLCQAFNFTRHKMEAKLRGCPVLRTGARGARIYDLSTAASYIVTPRVDLKAHIAKLDPKDLPEHLRSEFWASRLKEQKARLVAKDLWHTSDVQVAFSEVLKMIKDKVTLWSDTMDESVGLTAQQIEILDIYSRDLLSSVADAILAYADGGKTPSQESDFPDESLL